MTEQSWSLQLFQDNSEAVQSIHKDIDKIHSYKKQGAILRSGADWVEYGEKSSKLFFALEKSWAKKMSIQKLINHKGQMVKDNDGILQVMFRYYSDLFKFHTTKQDSNFLDDIDFPQITEQERDMLDVPITLAELDIV